MSKAREVVRPVNGKRNPAVQRQLDAGFPIAYLLPDGTMVEETPDGERFEITQKENEPKKIIRKL